MTERYFPITAAALRRLRFAFWDYVEAVAQSRKLKMMRGFK